MPTAWRTDACGSRPGGRVILFRAQRAEGHRGERPGRRVEARLHRPRAPRTHGTHPHVRAGLRPGDRAVPESRSHSGRRIVQPELERLQLCAQQCVELFGSERVHDVLLRMMPRLRHLAESGATHFREFGIRVRPDLVVLPRIRSRSALLERHGWFSPRREHLSRYSKIG